MGNCWRMPEDHADLLHVPATHYSSSLTTSMSSSSGPLSSVTHTIITTSDTPIATAVPKLVTLNRSSAHPTLTPSDLSRIQAAQCQNLVEHLPLIRYNEKTIKQSDCAICLIDFDPDEQVRQLPCDGAHVFHPSCIDGWLHKSLTCPHCSTNVDAALLLRFVPHSNSNDDDDW